MTSVIVAFIKNNFAFSYFPIRAVPKNTMLPTPNPGWHLNFFWGGFWNSHHRSSIRYRHIDGWIYLTTLYIFNYGWKLGFIFLNDKYKHLVSLSINSFVYISYNIIQTTMASSHTCHMTRTIVTWTIVIIIANLFIFINSYGGVL